MKKILLVFVCSLFAFETVLAQEKNAVGLRLGDGVEFLYQRDLSSRNFLQFTLATPHFEGLSVTGIYNWRCCPVELDTPDLRLVSECRCGWSLGAL